MVSLIWQCAHSPVKVLGIESFFLVLSFYFVLSAGVRSPSGPRRCGRVSSPAGRTVLLHCSVSGHPAPQPASLVSLKELKIWGKISALAWKPVADGVHTSLVIFRAFICVNFGPEDFGPWLLSWCSWAGRILVSSFGDVNSLCLEKIPSGFLPLRPLCYMAAHGITYCNYIRNVIFFTNLGVYAGVCKYLLCFFK